MEGDRASLLDPGLSLLEENETGIADAALVSPRRKPLTDDGVGACFDERILIPLSASGGGVEFRPVHLRSN